MLTDDARKELEEFGPANVRTHVEVSKNYGITGSIPFVRNHIPRIDVYEWLSKQDAAETKREDRTLRWAIIAGWAGIVSAILAGLAVVLPLMPFWPK